jgi:hypothetical protein
MIFCAIIAGYLTNRTDLEWLPPKRREWRHSIQVMILAATWGQAKRDVLNVLAYFLPEYRDLLKGATRDEYVFPGGTLSVIPWSDQVESARRKLQGPPYEMLLYNEWGPFRLWEEAQSRNPGGKPLLMQAATSGLENPTPAAMADMDLWRTRAKSGTQCENPEGCQHTEGERVPGIFHHWIVFKSENVPWMTDAAFRAYVKRLPVGSRPVRLGMSWDTVPEGRYWPLFSEAQQVKPFTLGDIVATCERLRQGVGSPTVTLAVATDCGYADHQASVLEAWYHAPCPACITMGQHRGKVRCGTCRGRGGACTPCLGSGKIACYTCNETGGQWYRWTLSDHKSKGGHLDKRPHNVAGILQMLVEAGVSTPGVAGPVAAGKMIDVFVADNQTAGQGDMTWQTEAEAIASLTGMPRHVPAYKVASERTQIEEGNALLQHERWVIHPRCVNVIAAMSAARWQPNGAPMRHDEAGSDTRAAIRYSGNHFLLRSPLKINRG